MIEYHAELDPYDWVFTFTMPYPTTKVMQALSPHTNGKNNWKKIAATKALRTIAKRVSSPVVGDIRWSQAVVHYKFYAQNRRSLDEANMIQRMKAAIDGIVDTGLLESDSNKHLTIGSVYSGVDPIAPRIQIVFQRLQKW